MSDDKARLENTMLGETVIYMDGTGLRHPALILSVNSDTNVNLMVLHKSTGTPFSVQNCEYSAVDANGRWWRRNKF